MSSAYREPPAHESSTGETLWSRSSRSSTLAVVFGIASAALGGWLYLRDPHGTVPLLVMLGAFSAIVLVVWAISSHNAVVAMHERGLRLGWLGGRTHFVPWEDVTRVDDELRRRSNNVGAQPYVVTEVVHVHCRGEVHSISGRLVGGKSLQEARRVLRAHVRAECFERSATGFEPPSRAVLAVGAAAAALSGVFVLVITAGAVRDASLARREWKAWPHVTATVIHNQAQLASSAPHAELAYEFEGRRYTRTSSVSTASADFEVGARVEQAVDPSDPSRGVTEREVTVRSKNLIGLLALCAIYGLVLFVVVRGRRKS